HSPLTVLLFAFFCYCPAHHPDLHSFPTRRSSDLQPTDTKNPMPRKMTLHRLLARKFAVSIHIQWTGNVLNLIRGPFSTIKNVISRKVQHGHLSRCTRPR